MSESQQAVVVEFHRGGIAAIDYAPASGVIAACSLPRPGLPPPAVLVWDWESAACLHAVHLYPRGLAPLLRRAATTKLLPGGYRPLRFAVGARVECRVGEDLWAAGSVAAHYPEEDDADEEPPPYLVRLDSEDMVYAPVDHAELIRAEGGGGEDVEWNIRTQAMEVAATASLVLHPSSTRLAIGMWHYGAAAGVLYSVDFDDMGAEAPAGPDV